MLATRYRPLPVWLGVVAAFGVSFVGRLLLRKVRLSIVRNVAGGICVVLAAVTLIGGLRLICPIPGRAQMIMDWLYAAMRAR